MSAPSSKRPCSRSGSAGPRAGKPGQPSMITRGGRVLGEIEEYFAETMTPGDTFVFAGEVLRFEGITENEAICSRAAPGTDPKVPSYAGGKFPLSTFLAARVRAMLANPKEWAEPAGRGLVLAACAAPEIAPAEARRIAGRDLSARRAVLSRRLPVRGPPRPSDARHAADAAAGAGEDAAARLRLQRLRHRRAGRSATCRRAIARGAP